MKKYFKQNDNNYCICYYRYSSHAQNEQSIDQQRELAQKYAEEHGYKIIKEYYDEALSGRDETRPQYRLMLTEVAKIKPAVLLLYKTDRLARDKYELIVSKKVIREAGCAIECIAEPRLDPNDPTSTIIEGMFDAMAEFYSVNLRQNVMRGLEYNANRALYNGHKLLGYKVDETKHYVIDEDTAPIVLHIYNQYAKGKGIQQIANELNAQGLKTTLNKAFNVNGLRHILKNRAYLGEYHYNDIIIPDGMPRIISDELFDVVQQRFELNKHKAKDFPKANEPEKSEPRFWLTGKLFCGECKESMHGISGTSKSGKIHYYYACANYRKHKCPLRNIRKDVLEECVIQVLRGFLSDSEKLASLAVDVSEYSQKNYSDDSYLKSLTAEFRKTETELKNVVDAIKQGCFNDIIQNALTELENRKNALEQAIEAENIKLSLAQNDHSIKHYFEMYSNADFDDEQTRNYIFEYFIDKIYVFEDKLIVDMFYSDDHAEVNFDAFVAEWEENQSVRQEDSQFHLLFLRKQLRH